MHRPEKWWIGLVPLGVIFLAAMMFRTSPVESDLVARAGEELKRSGLDWAKASLVGRDAVIEGVAPEPGSQGLARDAADRAWGVRRVTDKTTVLPEQKPYVVSAAREGAKITLTGSVPNNEVRAASVAAAKAAFANADVVDQRTLARGAPAAYSAALAHGLAQLGRLAAGSASLTDAALSVSGPAADFPGFDAATAAMRALPPGVALGKAEITPPRISPFALSAVKTAQGVTLTGVIPDESLRAGLLAAARAAAGSGQVTDSLRVANGAPVSFGPSAALALAQLPRLVAGSVGVTDAAISVVGLAADFAGFDAATAALKTLPEGATLARAEIAPPRISPFALSAVKTAQGVTLTGVIPDESLRAGLLAAARAAAGSGQVTDSLRVATGAPASFGPSAALALAQLPRLVAGSAGVSDAAISVVGQATDFAGLDAATAALKALPEGATLARAEIAPPRVSPFEFNAVKSAAGVTLTGVISAESVRSGILAAARTAAGAGGVTDSLRVADGAPAGVDLGAAASFALGQLARLATGQATISDQTLRIAGAAPTVPAYHAVTSALGAASLPGSVRLASQAITGPTQSPYTWGARHDASGVTLTGFVPDDGARGVLIEAAKTLFPGVNIVDQLQLALGAPGGFLEAARAGLAQLARLASGTATVNNAALTIAGEALQGQAADQVRAALASGLPQGFQGQANITVRPPPPPPPAPAASSNLIVPSLPPVVLSPLAQECQDKFNKLLAAEQINFASGRADIQEDSNELIKALAAEAKRCPSASIEVQGHTDSDGNPDSNKTLSERRAQAVATRLADFGVEKHRLGAAGFGQTRPLAPNDTAENKAKNRRIEFSVTE